MVRGAIARYHAQIRRLSPHLGIKGWPPLALGRSPFANEAAVGYSAKQINSKGHMLLVRLPLEEVISAIRKELEAKDRIREEVLALSRTVTRLSAQAILSIHKAQLDLASGRLEEARRGLDRMEAILRDCPEILYKGFVYTAYQEYAEASLLLGFVAGKGLPTPERLSVPPIPYVLGLADVVGELRRRAVDSLRVRDLEAADRCLAVMEDIYESLLSIERGYALIPGFRGKLDAIRRGIEETRGDILRAGR